MLKGKKENIDLRYWCEEAILDEVHEVSGKPPCKYNLKSVLKNLIFNIYLKKLLKKSHTKILICICS